MTTLLVVCLVLFVALVFVWAVDILSIKEPFKRIGQAAILIIAAAIIAQRFGVF